MVKNPITWQEEEWMGAGNVEVKSTFAPDDIIIPWVNTMATEKTPELPETPKIPEIWGAGLMWPEKPETPKIDTSLIPTPEWDKKVFWKAFWEDITTPEPTNAWITWLDPTLDKELGKLKEQKEEKITEEIKSYNLAKWEFERAKWFYKNFDDVNKTFEWVLWDLEWIQRIAPGSELTDSQMQEIADRYWVSLEEVKDPTSIFNKLELTDEWKDKFWVTKAQDAIDKLWTDFERKKEDLAFQLEWTQNNLNNQISDTQETLKRNLDVMTAMWVWSWWLRSSWYEQWIQNVKDDWQKTINRLVDMSKRVDEANTTNIERLTEDYNNAVSTAKQDLDSQLETIKFDTWIQMNTAAAKYDISSLELKNALDAINEEFWTKSLDTYNKYLTNMRAINDIVSSNLDNQEQIMSMQDAKVNQRYNELLANNWLLLQNTWLTWLQQEVEAGTLSLKRFNDIKNIMQSSIVNTLQGLWTVNQADLNTINNLLSQGKTPTEIVAKMQELEKFTPIVDEDKDFWFTKISEWVIAVTDPVTWKVKFESISWQGQEVAEAEVINNTVDFIKSSEWFRGQAYDDATWKILAPWETPQWTATIWYWFTTINGKPVQAWDIMTQDEADTEFAKQIKNYQNFENFITTPLNENQRTALTSFEYNIWSWVWQQDPELTKAINDGNFEEAARIMKLYTQANWEFMQWLQNRRNKEASLLLKETKAHTIDASEKNAILEQIKTWQFTPSEISWFRKKSIEEWWADEFTESLAWTTRWKIAQEEDDLRWEFEWKDAVKNYRLAQKTVQELEWMLSAETWSWDMAAVFSFMKALDPSSVVRETEFEAAANTSWIMDKATSLSLWRKASSWEILTPKQRQQFLDVVKEVMNTRKSAYDKKVEQYSRLAEDRWVDKNNVILDLERKPELTEEEIAEIKAENKKNSLRRLLKLSREGMYVRPDILQEAKQLEIDSLFE